MLGIESGRPLSGCWKLLIVNVRFLSLLHQGKMDLISDIYKYVNNTYLFHATQILSLGHIEYLKLVKLNISSASLSYESGVAISQHGC
jgi:hypothetical protein